MERAAIDRPGSVPTIQFLRASDLTHGFARTTPRIPSFPRPS